MAFSFKKNNFRVVFAISANLLFNTLLQKHKNDQIKIPFVDKT